MSLRLSEAVDDSSVVEMWTIAMDGIKNAINEHLWDSTQNLFFDNDINKTKSSLRPQDGNSWAVIAGVVNRERAKSISTALAGRWVRPYGAPAPEAGATISPFASGFEVQAHFLSGNPERARELIEFMWADFMLGDPRMTNSSFIEGYSTNGDLHYAPYDNDARVSHAHGWATGPTSALTFFAAGLQLTSAVGKTWLVQPGLGSLRRVTAGFETSMGEFSASWSKDQNENLLGVFKTPRGTTGTLILPGTSPNLVVGGPQGVVTPSSSVRGDMVFQNLPGGSYQVRQS